MPDTEKKKTQMFILVKSFFYQNGRSKTQKFKKQPSLAFFYSA